MNNVNDSEVSNIFGININKMVMEDVISIIDNVISERGHLRIGVVNAAKIINMHKDKYLMDDVTSSDIVLADGASVVLASRILGDPLPERVTGIDLMYELLKIGNDKKYKIFCLGASEDISKKVVEKIQEDYPGVEIVGRRNGYYTNEEEKSVAMEIANSGADILFVAMTSPKKENFIAQWDSTINIPILHGVGGSFDVMAGKVKRAPLLWQNLGMEWLYRVKQEPGRLWKRYLITNIQFAWCLLREIPKKYF